MLHAHQRAGVTHRAHVNLAAREEGHSTAQINGKAAFDAAKDRTINTSFVSVGTFQTVPGFFALGLVAANQCLATGVLNAVQIHLDFVADRDISGAADIGKFFQINAAFHFVANVDDGLARFNRDNLAFDNRPSSGVSISKLSCNRASNSSMDALVAISFQFPFHRLLALRLAPPVFELRSFWPHRKNNEGSRLTPDPA